MNIYIILLAVIILVYILLYKVFKIKDTKKYFCIIVFVLFTLLQGLRESNVGNDTENYIKFYNLARNMNIFDIILCKNWVIEPGYGLLMKLCSVINLPSQVYLMVVATIINGGFTYFIFKQSKNPLLSTIIFMGAEFFTLSFTALRQMIAVIIVLNSYTYIKQKKTFKFILMILLAATFHKSALIFMPVYLLKDIKISKKTIIIGISIFIVVQLLTLPIITFLTEKLYYKSYLNSTGGGITQALVILTYLLFGLYSYKFTEKKDDILYILIYIAFLIQSMAYKIDMINRLMWYYYIFITIFLPTVVYSIKKHKSKVMGEHINCIIMILSVIQYIFFSVNMYNILPYKIY